MPARVCGDRVVTTEPMALKASLLGAKMVRSERPLRVSASWAAVAAPAREVRPVLTAVWATLGGTVRTVSMMWMRPPLKPTSWGSGLVGLFDFRSRGDVRR